MPYMNPGVAAARGIEEFVLQRDQLARQARLDAIVEARERRAQEAQDFEMSQAKDQAAQANFARKIANLMPGDIPDAATKAEAERLGVPLAMAKAPMIEVPAGESEVQLPSGENGELIETPEGSDAPRSAMADMPGASPSIRMPIAPAYAGDAKYRMGQMAMQQNTAMQKQLADAIAQGATREQAAQIGLEAGMDSEDIKRIIDAIKPATKKVYRSSADRRTIEEFGDGKWSPLMGDPDKDAQWLQEPNPTNINMGAQDIWGDMKPNEWDTLARTYIRTGQMPAFGSGNSAAGARRNFIRRVNQYDQATDKFIDDPDATVQHPDLASNAMDFAADKGSLSAITKNLDAATAFQNVAEKNAQLLATKLKGIPDSGYQFVNRVWRPVAGQAQRNQQAMAAFNVYRQSVANEYARLLSQPNLTGVLSDSARHEAGVLLDPNATEPQFIAAVQALANEGANRVQEYQSQINTIRQRGVPQATTPTNETPEQRKARLRQIYLSGGVP